MVNTSTTTTKWNETKQKQKHQNATEKMAFSLTKQNFHNKFFFIWKSNEIIIKRISTIKAHIWSYRSSIEPFSHLLSATSNYYYNNRMEVYNFFFVLFFHRMKWAVFDHCFHEIYSLKLASAIINCAIPVLASAKKLSTQVTRVQASRLVICYWPFFFLVPKW